MRRKQPSVEEISSSLLLDDASGMLPPPSPLEEISSSLLLEEPSDAGIFGQPGRLARPPAASAPLEPSRFSGQPGANVGPKRASAPPAAHGARLGLPELPTSTPGPNLDGSPSLPMVFESATTTLRPAPPDTEPGGLNDGAPNADSTVPMPALEVLSTVQMPTLVMTAETALRDAPQTPGVDAAPNSQATRGGSTAPVEGDVEVTALPRGALTTARETLERGWQKLRSGDDGPRPPWFLPAVAAGGLAVGIGLVAIIVSMARGGASATDAQNENAAPSASVATSPNAPNAPAAMAPREPVAAGLPAAPAPEPAAVVETTACKVAGAPHVVAASAIVSAGIEVRTLGDAVGLGFAPNDHDAVAVRIDPATMAQSTTMDSPAVDSVRRVVPYNAPNGELGVGVDVDHDGDPLQGRRTIPLDPPVQIGASGGHLSWARMGAPAAGVLWPLDGSGDVEALRGATEPAAAGAAAGGPVTVVALRRANAIWIGAAAGRDALVPQGALTRIAGFGTAVGSPAVALNEGVVLVAWADRAAATDPWRLRWVRFKAGEAPGEPGTFTPPAGGKGEQAMSPGLAAVPGGRFLLVWTEGPASRHDVRALTLTRDGQPLGAPLEISRKKVNAGQGQVAVTAARKGLVAFLESSEGGFEVVATPIRCD